MKWRERKDSQPKIHVEGKADEIILFWVWKSLLSQKDEKM